MVDLLQDAGAEVEARRRRGGRACVVRVHGLVPLGIPLRLVDVRRQRHLAVRLAREPHEPAPLAELVDELGGGRIEPRTRGEPFSGAEPARRARERLPHVVLPPLNQEHLDVAAGRASQEQPGRDDARVVDDHEMAVELLGQVAEGPVADLPARTVEDQHPRRVPRLDRMLSDEVAGQVVVELV